MKIFRAGTSAVATLSSLIALSPLACSGNEGDPIGFRTGGSGSGGENAGTGGANAGTGGASAGTGGASAGTGGASAGTGGASGPNTGGTGSGGMEPGGTGGAGGPSPKFGDLYGPCDVDAPFPGCAPDADGKAISCMSVLTADGNVGQCLYWIDEMVCDATDDHASCAFSDIYGKGDPQCSFFPDPHWTCTLGCTTSVDCPAGLECKSGYIFVPHSRGEQNMCVPVAP